MSEKRDIRHPEFARIPGMVCTGRLDTEVGAPRGRERFNFGVPFLGLLPDVSLTGCIVVGYSSRGGFSLPGGLGLMVLVLLIAFVLRRR
jgi:hypothetical protein